MNLLDNKVSESYTESNTVVFYDTNKDLFVKEVNEFNEVTDHTNDVNKALAMPNTINFKNSKKYTTLIQQQNIEPLNKVVNKITEVTLKGL